MQPDMEPQHRLDTGLLLIPILVAALANKDLLDLLVRPETTELTEKMDRMDKKVPPERTVKSCCLLCHQRNHALFARQVSKETLDSPARKDHLDLKENPQKRPMTERKENPACRDHKEFPAPPDRQDLPDLKVNPELSIKLMDPLGQLDRKDLPDLSARKVNPVAMESKDLKDRSDHRETMEKQGLKEILETQAREDHRENQVQPVNAIIVHLPEHLQATRQFEDIHPHHYPHLLLLLLFNIIAQNWPFNITTTKRKS